jgi:cell shape-determining protein MreD
MDIVTIIIQIIVGVVISAPALWLAGRWRVGPARALFMDAVTITVLGVIADAIVGEILGGGLGSLVQLGIYLYLVQKYYETDWVDAAIIAVIAFGILFVATMILGILGFAILGPSIAGAF